MQQHTQVIAGHRAIFPKSPACFGPGARRRDSRQWPLCCSVHREPVCRQTCRLLATPVVKTSVGRFPAAVWLPWTWQHSVFDRFVRIWTCCATFVARERSTESSKRPLLADGTRVEAQARHVSQTSFGWLHRETWPGKIVKSLMCDREDETTPRSCSQFENGDRSRNLNVRASDAPTDRHTRGKTLAGVP